MTLDPTLTFVGVVLAFFVVGMLALLVWRAINRR